MRLSTAQDLSFKDLPYICLPLFAKKVVERHLCGRFSCGKIINVNQFISNKAPNLERGQLDALLSKIDDGWIFLVYSVKGNLPAETLMSLKANHENETNIIGKEVEHWLPHPSLAGTAKFNTELLIQRLTYHERVYGTVFVHNQCNAGEHQWPVKNTQAST